RKVVDSYDVLGGPHTFNAVWATAKFYDGNRKVVEAFVSALVDVMKQIAKDPAGAAALWIKAENSKLPHEYVEKIIHAADDERTMVPKKIMAYADFMHRVGALPAKPANWQEGFSPDISSLAGE